MEYYHFADCCTARVIEGFSGRTQAQLKRDLLQVCADLNEEEDEAREWAPDAKYEDLRNLGLIFATTTTAQEEANIFLKSVGFKRCGSPAAKGRHQETKLIGWYIKSSTLYKWWKNNKG